MTLGPSVYIRTCILTGKIMSRDSAVGMATGCKAGLSRDRSSSPGRVKNFYLPITSPLSGGRSVGIVRSQTQATELVIPFRPAPGPTQPPFQ
jgi:hypothetical protein